MNEKTKSRNSLAPRVLFGIESSFTADYLDTLERLAIEVATGVLSSPPNWSLRGVPIVLHPEDISPLLLELPVVLCPMTPGLREAARQQALSLGFVQFASVVDPSAIVSGSIYAGQGLFINANATLGAEVELDDFVTVNRAASIGHHTVLEAFSTVGPGATLASHCRVGKRVMIGAGAVVAPNVRIGEGATVAAGAVVFREVEAGTTVIGNPARISKLATDKSISESP
jgi:sugar O-acyltransferase (sialic acid O-acetyltransferase NeuD family)